MDHIRWVPNQDTCSEIRRKVHKSRLERGILSGAEGPVASPSGELQIVCEFLREEFGELTSSGYVSSVVAENLPDVKSWDYPGEWVTPFYSELADHFVRDGRGFLFSTSGSFTLAIHKKFLVQ